MKTLSYNEIISSENLFQAWNTFKKGKRKRLDVMLFEQNLEGNIFELHASLKNKIYRHDIYSEFFVNDPKRRHIHKATVKDRIVHQILYDYLVDIFEKTFIFDSYSCRVGKGTHKGVKRLSYFFRKVSKKYTNPCWALKLDIKKFFASVDHSILFGLIEKKIKDEDTLWLLERIITSFETEKEKGIPLGNLTSQVFANIYLNKLDQFFKHKLKVKYYIRYADDFIIIDRNRTFLYQCIDTSKQFLNEKLALELHSDKISIRKLEWGIDFLGYIILPHCIIPRTTTKRRMFKNLESKTKDFYRGNIDEFSLGQAAQSYMGYLSYANAFRVKNKLQLMM